MEAAPGGAMDGGAPGLQLSPAGRRIEGSARGGTHREVYPAPIGNTGHGDCPAVLASQAPRRTPWNSAL